MLLYLTQSTLSHLSYRQNLNDLLYKQNSSALNFISQLIRNLFLHKDNFKRVAIFCRRVSNLHLCCTSGVRTCSTTTVLKSHWQYVSLYKALEGYFWFFALNDLIARCLSRMWHFCTETMCKILHNARSIKTGQ